MKAVKAAQRREKLVLVLGLNTPAKICMGRQLAQTYDRLTVIFMTTINAVNT